ncbi:GntR family transcriptional regulator [Actinomycetospora termitidis]|uniref:GntR family transcriptional regulator n=1 Tax=Actinomycetospora termitidis TaxID=3053470 RepID=A0ABT7M614_9PSEU|nr:GntR family transcriptional regulator [Actinomycetospora sp. Odt1-22]MDL5156112.1 GntR family transcriptional regulator [Actinomycetospora sp. Odt1-22]
MTGTHPHPDEEAGARSTAYRRIREDIVGGVLAPGWWVREGALAEQLGVSRTPVREALNALAAEGLVEIVRHRGARVLPWTMRDVDEVYSIRAVLEGEGARLAAIRASDEEVQGLWESAERFEQAARELVDLRARGRGGDAAARGAVDAVTEANGVLHRAVLTAAGSPRLTVLLRSLSSEARIGQVFHHYTDADLTRSMVGHHDIVLGIERHDAPLAESAMRSHILAARHAAARSASDAPAPSTRGTAQIDRDRAREGWGRGQGVP